MFTTGIASFCTVRVLYVLVHEHIVGRQCVSMHSWLSLPHAPVCATAAGGLAALTDKQPDSFGSAGLKHLRPYACCRAPRPTGASRTLKHSASPASPPQRTSSAPLSYVAPPEADPGHSRASRPWDGRCCAASVRGPCSGWLWRWSLWPQAPRRCAPSVARSRGSGGSTTTATPVTEVRRHLDRSRCMNAMHQSPMISTAAYI